MQARLGPVFATELRIRARRWQVYAGRALFVVALLAGMILTWWDNSDLAESATIEDLAEVGQNYFLAVVGIQLALTMIVAPASAAGAICVERSRGSLAHMLVTDLRPWEIIGGKFLARFLPIAALIACAWPVAALGTLLGGIGPEDLTLAFAITLAVGVVGCALALALSTWLRSTHEVLLVVYLFWAVILLAYPLAYSLSLSVEVGLKQPWMLTLNPFWLAYVPYLDPGRVDRWDYVGFFAGAGGLSGLSLVAAVAGVRRNPLGAARPRPRRDAASGRSRVARLVWGVPGPRLDTNPVLWREWHRARSSRAIRVVLATSLGASLLACGQGAWEILSYGIGPRVGFLGVMTALAQTVFGLLVVTVFAALAFTEERRRGSLDVLLATPLATRTIVVGKYLASLRALPLLAVGPALVGGALAVSPLPSTRVDLEPAERALGAALMPLTVLAHGAWLASLGLAVSVRIRRESRAMALMAMVYVVLVIGVPIAAIVLANPDNGPFSSIGPILASSPAFAIIQIVDGLATVGMTARTALQCIAFWDLVAVGAALIVLAWTIRGFDRQFDRVPERARRPRW